jgi:acyl-CoA reductase-like NAD-dependent aldehyde dehydrogenase
MTELEIRNPATDECIGVLQEAELSGLDQTIQSAHRAQSHWAGLLASERSDILVRWHQLDL